MVRAILSGNKTQTRRIIKIQPPDGWGGTSSVVALAGHCPFGKVGDRLWVRETWSSDFANYYPNDDVWYAADDNRRLDIEEVNGVRGIYSPESDVHVPFRWRPSIHMPRWASRITLEITDIRVERLRAISESDAVKEGVPPAGDLLPNYPDTYLTPKGDFATAKVAFQRLWESIYGQDSWQSNPFVWVVEFKRVEAV
ncbi:hypothetical protein [Rosenbergiella collisarenosi]|uniref:hypothetical protein n=1 Tax=Rosenbergiella collisarenosi TaxID=1544695 RepID=UPI001FD3C2EC|nr:hypothetical protein [Rosenbergiella collisarenosi]